MTQDVDPPPRVLTASEAAQLYNFPLDRLLRRLDAGGVPGAFKGDGRGTRKWCIPENSLMALGYSPAEAARVQETAAAGTAFQRLSGGDAPGGLGQLAADLRRQAAAELTELEAHRRELEAERQELDVERLRLAADRQELEAAFATVEEYGAALEAEMADFEKIRTRVDDRARALALDRRRLTAESKRLAAEDAHLAGQREELEALRRQVEDERLELRRRPPDSRSLPGERPARRRRAAPQPPPVR